MIASKMSEEPMIYRRTARYCLLALYAVTTAALGVDLYAVGGTVPWCAKALSTSGYLAALTALVQLDVAGFFDRLLAVYDDPVKYPYGPPSRVGRETIDNPDRPIRTWVRNIFERDLRTGFWLIVAATVLQLAGTLAA